MAGRPVAAHLLERLAMLDLDAVAVNLHHGAELVERCLGPGPTYVREDWLRGTAGAIAGAAGVLGRDTVLVASADGLHAIDMSGLIAHHRASGAAATITVKRIANPETCAIVEMDGRGLVTRFVEKPPVAEVFTDIASIGVYCVEPDVLELIPRDRPYDIAGELIPALLATGHPVSAYSTDAWWSDIGTPADLLAANLAAARGEIEVLHADDGQMGEGVRVYRGSEIAPGARVEAPVVAGPGSVIGSGAHVRAALVLPGARIADGEVVIETIRGDGAGVLRSWLRDG